MNESVDRSYSSRPSLAGAEAVVLCSSDVRALSSEDEGRSRQGNMQAGSDPCVLKHTE